MNELENLLEEIKNNRLAPTNKPLVINRATTESPFTKELRNIVWCSLGLDSPEHIKEPSPITGTAFTVYDDVNTLNQALQKYFKHPAVAVSFAAFGKDGKESTDPFSSEIAYLALSFGEDSALVVNINSVSMKPLQSLFSSKLLKVFYRATDFLVFAKKHDLTLNNISDVDILDQLLNKGLDKPSVSLEHLSQKRLNKSFRIGELKQDYSQSYIASIIAGKASAQLELARHLFPLIRQENMLELAQMEHGACYAIAEMRYNGMPFDTNIFRALKKERENAVLSVRNQLNSVLRYTVPSTLGNITKSVNPDSASQVIKAFSELGINVSHTNKEELRPYVDRYPEVALYLEYTKLNYSLQHTLSASYLNRVNPITDCIHATIKQIGTVTGRIIMVEPNLLGVAHGDPRKVFRAPEGYLFVTGDYKQIDIVAIAVLSEEPVMLREINSGEDVYIVSGKMFLDKENLSENERSCVKPIVLGMIYDMTDEGICQAVKPLGMDLRLVQAAEWRQMFFNKYQGIKAWQESLKREVQEKREVRSLMNRARAFDNVILMIDKPVDLSLRNLKKMIASSVPQYKMLSHQNGVILKIDSMSESEEAAAILKELDLNFKVLPDVPPPSELFNAPAQMSVADLIKTTMTDMLPHLARSQSFFTLSTYDDLTYLAPADRLDEFSHTLKNVMEEASRKVMRGTCAKVKIISGDDYSQV